MTLRNAGVAAVALVLVACGPYPRDIEGTFERVRRDGVLRVAFAELDGKQSAVAKRYSESVATSAGARVQERPSAATETLFAELEKGDLDLVIAEVANDSPWAGRVALVEPLMQRLTGDSVMALTPVARSGENQWIGLLEREARDTEHGP